MADLSRQKKIPMPPKRFPRGRHLAYVTRDSWEDAMKGPAPT
jgi:hypothetical protein